MMSIERRIYEALMAGTASLPMELTEEVYRRNHPVVHLPETEHWPAGSIAVRINTVSGSWNDLAPSPPAGIRVEQVQEPGEDPYTRWLVPELGVPVYLRQEQLVVIPLPNGQRFQVRRVHSKLKDSLGPWIEGDMLLFIPTQAPLTGSNARAPLKGYRHFGFRLFGQPEFNQGEVYPEFEGRAAYLLWTQETGVGDSGQENMFLGLDAEGLPCRVWKEESSC